MTETVETSRPSIHGVDETEATGAEAFSATHDEPEPPPPPEQPPLPLATKAGIIAVDDLQHEYVAVPEWNMRVLVWGLTATEREAWELSTMKVVDQEDVDNVRKKTYEAEMEDFRLKLLVRCIRDEAGERIFGDDEIAALGAKNAAVIERLHDVARRLSGITDKDVDELAKNLEGAPSDGSASD